MNCRPERSEGSAVPVTSHECGAGAPDTQLTFEFNEALLYQQEGNYREALEKLGVVLSRYGPRLNHPELRFIYEDVQQRRAFLSLTLRQFQDAVPLFREILSFEMKNDVRSDALSSLGLCYLELRDWRLAKEYFLQASALGVTSEREKTFHFYLGIAYFYTEDLAAAKREFKICEEHASEYELPALDVYAWLSSVSKRLGEIAESERYAAWLGQFKLPTPRARRTRPREPTA